MLVENSLFSVILIVEWRGGSKFFGGRKLRCPQTVCIISIYANIGHRNFHPKSLNNGFLRLWLLDYKSKYNANVPYNHFRHAQYRLEAEARRKELNKQPKCIDQEALKIEELTHACTYNSFFLEKDIQHGMGYKFDTLLSRTSNPVHSESIT